MNIKNTKSEPVRPAQLLKPRVSGRFCLFLLLFLYISGSSLTGYSQELEGAIGFHGFVDNREYAQSERNSQTIFGARFSPEGGILLDSVHRLRIGVNLLHEFGSPDFIADAAPVIYYQYQKQNHTFYLGAFPRYQLLDDYPRMILADTFNYFRPNIEGMLYRYATSTFKETIWIDWTGKQTDTDRETFLFGFSGKYQPGRFFISHYASMYHNALSKLSPPDQHLEDNGAVQLQIGYDFSHQTFLDSLTIAAGPTMSIERVRNVTDLNTPTGFVADLYASYKKFSVMNTFYTGDGHYLINGDAFYTSKSYNRLDLCWTPFQLKNIEGRLAFTFHFVDGVTSNQQAFSLRYHISGKKRLK